MAHKEDIPGSLLLFNDILDKGFDGHLFLVGLAGHYRNLLICKDHRTAQLLEVVESVQERYIQQSKDIDNQTLLRSMAVLSKADVEYKAAKNQRLLVEINLMQLCSLKKSLKLTNPVRFFHLQDKTFAT